MRHRNRTRHFNRTPSHRRAMLRNMAASLLRSDEDADNPGRIITTPEKAKECRRLVERLITLAKKGGVANFRHAVSLLGDKEMVYKLFNDIAPRYLGRQGGYTRILHLSDVRLGDAAPQCIFELVEKEPEAAPKKPRKKAATKSRAKKRAEKPAGGAEEAEAKPEETASPVEENAGKKDDE